MNQILNHKYYEEPSVFQPENLLREARRQKNKKQCDVPAVCILDPDGDLAEYLISKGDARLNECWACYHSKLYTSECDGVTVGIVPCIVGASYAVLVSEQLFVSGCKLLISVTSAGIISQTWVSKRFGLITHAVRDEGTSYHYLPPDRPSILNEKLRNKLLPCIQQTNCPFFEANSWTTDAPYRETQSAIEAMQQKDVICVEMEAAALYALSTVKSYDIICFAHLTNSMAQKEGDFEKGEAFGSIDTLALLSYLLKVLPSEQL